MMQTARSLCVHGRLQTQVSLNSDIEKHNAPLMRHFAISANLKAETTGSIFFTTLSQ